MRDVFFMDQYSKLYENENQRADRFVFKCEFGTVENLVMFRSIPDLVDGIQYYDVITPYGYGGPYVECAADVPKLIERYNRAWEQYCTRQRIVSEFMRFHLFDNAGIRDILDADIQHVSDNIVVDTTKTEDALWREFEYKVRKNVNKAKRSKLTVVQDSSGVYLEEFLRIYYATMDRNQASRLYYFDKSYFEELNETLRGNYIYFYTIYEERIISVELVLCSESYAYSFLGGTDASFYELRPNDLLKWDIIRWCCETGRKKFILGGGYHPNDGIYQFKKSFSPHGDTPFYIGKKIHDTEIYARLVEIHANQENFDAQSPFFPLYRMA